MKMLPLPIVGIVALFAHADGEGTKTALAAISFRIWLWIAFVIIFWGLIACFRSGFEDRDK